MCKLICFIALRYAGEMFSNWEVLVQYLPRGNHFFGPLNYGQSNLYDLNVSSVLFVFRIKW